MNWVDITIFVICFILFLVGYRRGLINQIFSVAALVGGVLCGFILFDIAGLKLVQTGIVESRATADIIGFIAVAVIAYIIIQLIGSLITRLLGTLKLGWLNRLAGGAIGVVIGLILSFFFISSLYLFLDNDRALKQSQFASKVEYSYKYLRSLVPPNLQKQYNDAKKIIREKSAKGLSIVM